MEPNKKWDFKCVQFLDFNAADVSDTETESYFDKKDDSDLNSLHELIRNVPVNMSSNIDRPDKENEQSKFQAKKRPVYKFTASFSKPKPEPSSKDERNVFALKAKTNKTTFQSFHAVVKKRQSLSKPIKPFTKPVVVSKPTAVPRENRRQISPTPGPSVPAPSQPLYLRPRTTRPTTPQCLKRSMLLKSKVVKSTEDLELEKISEMRRKVKSNLDLNKATMNKIRAPALRPLLERRPPAPITETIPKKTDADAQKKADATFKKPAMVPKAKTTIGFDAVTSSVPKTPIDVPSTSRFLKPDRRLSRSESSLSSISRLNKSTGHRSLRSLNACHSGVKFVPKQNLKLPALASGSSNLENKNVTSTWKTPKADQPNPVRRTLINRSFAVNKISKPFQDRINMISSKFVPKKAVKRHSSVCLSAKKSEKRRKI